MKKKRVMIRHDTINGWNEVHDEIYGKFTLDQVVYLNKAPLLAVGVLFDCLVIWFPTEIGHVNLIPVL